MARGKPDVVFIKTARQMRALSAPLRLRIFEVLAKAGVLSVAEMAAAVGRPPAAIYQHVELLRRAGMIRRAGFQGEGRDKSRLYMPVARGLKAATNPSTAEQRRALARLGQAHARHVLRYYERAVLRGEAELQGPHRNAVVRHMAFSPRPGDLASFNAELDAFVARWSARATTGAPTISLLLAMAPVPQKP
jgi:DNA-binding transcriptional ArsR family regulator